jgi:H+/gluconate symporter-like permease
MAGGEGSFPSVLFSYGMDKYLVRLDWNLRPVPALIAAVITILFPWAVGLFSSRNILNNRPLQTLRRHE